MYLPYLRGKQNEMLALRELINVLISKKTKVSPIIEPVTKSNSFRKSLETLLKNGINFTIILNPQVGSLQSYEELISFVTPILKDYSNYQIGIIVEKNFDASKIVQDINNNELTPRGYTLIHNTTNQIHSEEINILRNHLPIIFDVINLDKTKDNINFINSFRQNTRLALADYFKSQTKNILYLDNPDSTFSNHYRTYYEQKNMGFGDYLTVGDKFFESGASPYAIAIHISYADNNAIQVKHFTSDSNEDQSDPALKFSEANQKLVNWCSENSIETLGCQGFKNLYNTQHYPGLGIIKKLSIMNHIELILSLI